MEKEEDSRRAFLRKVGFLSAGAALASCAPAALTASAGTLPQNNPSAAAGSSTEPLLFKQEPLPYAFDALEPYIDKQTMEIHYGKHHAGYVNNLNKALAAQKTGYTGLEDILANISKYPTAVRNNAGGHWNHTMFWSWMKPNGKDTYAGKIATAVNAQFGSLDKFKEQFTDAAMKRFGSGWAWLIDKGGKLEIVTSPNQDNPLMDTAEIKGKPLLGIDVWEHAYYLKYQNLRKDYITNWFNIVNWEKVNSMM